jgi:hypothetical protein
VADSEGQMVFAIGHTLSAICHPGGFDELLE